MSIAPFADYRPIPSTVDPPITPVGMIFHVDAGNAASLWNWFSTGSGGIESHFHVRKDGHVEQYRDTNQEADANYRANSFLIGGKRYGFISVETQGYASGEWTEQQLDSLLRLAQWAIETHKIPRRVAPAWNEGGFGYHVMFPDHWTNVRGKTCPGPKRIEQFHSRIVPWINQEDDMPSPKHWDKDDWKAFYLNAGWGYPARTGTAGGKRINMRMQQDRVYRDIQELIGAHRDDDLGTGGLDADQIDRIATDLRARLGDDFARAIGEKLVS